MGSHSSQIQSLPLPGQLARYSHAMHGVLGQYDNCGFSCLDVCLGFCYLKELSILFPVFSSSFDVAVWCARALYSLQPSG